MSKQVRLTQPLVRDNGRLRPASWDESKQTVTTTICPYCGVGCNLDLHVQDNRIVKVTSPWTMTSAAATCA